MTEVILIIFAAGLIYFVATKIAPKGLLFKLKKDEEDLNNSIREKFAESERRKELDLIDRGQKLLNKGNLMRAEKIFLQTIQINPKESKAYHFLGMIYLRQNEYKGAVEALRMTTSLDQLNDTAYNNLGLALHNLKKYQEAIEAFKKSIQLNDKIAHRYVNIGLSQQGLNDFEAAALSFENAARIHENTENLTLLAKNYIKLKDKKLTKKSLERLLAIDPTNNWAKRMIISHNN